jgi:hypothetical protein
MLATGKDDLVCQVARDLPGFTLTMVSHERNK